MDQLYFSAEIEDGRALCLAPLTDEQIENSGQQIDDLGGYFLFERDTHDPSRIEIIAKLISEDAIFKLKTAFNLK